MLRKALTQIYLPKGNMYSQLINKIQHLFLEYKRLLESSSALQRVLPRAATATLNGHAVPSPILYFTPQNFSWQDEEQKPRKWSECQQSLGGATVWGGLGGPSLLQEVCQEREGFETE